MHKISILKSKITNINGFKIKKFTLQENQIIKKFFFLQFFNKNLYKYLYVKMDQVL